MEAQARRRSRRDSLTHGREYFLRRLVSGRSIDSLSPRSAGPPGSRLLDLNRGPTAAQPAPSMASAVTWRLPIACFA